MSEPVELSKYKRAIGLRYLREEQESPSIHVLSEGLNADKVVKLAKRFGVPVIDRPELVQALAACELDQSIPPELFEAIALIIAELERKR